jgi:tripeptidyl-peptidase I
VDALVAPHPTTLSLVESWLASHNVDPSSAVQHAGASSWLSFSIPVAQAELMLNTKYNVYFNPSTSSYIVRTLEYSLPGGLHSHIDVISPTTHFGSLKAMKATSFLMPEAVSPAADRLAGPCSSEVTPQCLRIQYNSSTYVPSATSRNKLGIAGYLQEYANDADLQVYELVPSLADPPHVQEIRPSLISSARMLRVQLSRRC